MFAEKSLYGLVLVCVTIYPLILAEKADGCGQSDVGPQSGLLSSKNYPGKYPNNSLCEWKIRVNSSLRIVLKFEDVSIGGVDCETDYLKVLKENHGTTFVYWQHCGEMKPHPPVTSQPLYTDASELTVSFRSSRHSAGRGFRLSYTTVNQTELLTCTDKGSHFSLSRYRKFCPAGCGAAAGDVAGDISQGYRHTSVLCKAAVHAGIFPDEYGGAITVEEQRGLRFYESVRANGVRSITGSLSDTLFTFVTNDCSKQMVLQPVSVSATWEKDVFDGTRSDWSPDLGDTISQTGIWDNESDGKHWLQLDLGEKKRITGILAKVEESGYFVKSYKIVYKEKSRWRTYRQYNSSEDTIFEGNEDDFYQTRSTFRPSFIARYVRVVPLQWHRRISLSAELLGCSYVPDPPKVNVTPPVLQEVLSSQPKPDEDKLLPEPDWSIASSTSPALSITHYTLACNAVLDAVSALPFPPNTVKLVIILVSAVVCVAVVLVSAICAFKLLQKKKSKENMYDSADVPQTGCWKQVKHASARQQSTEFTFSYSSEKDHLPKIDLVTSDMADYQQPLMLGVETVSRKGSTFRPMDTDTKDNANEAASHYDYLHTANQYALPLTNQEPEYATPIIERHTFRKDVFFQDPSYSVPGVVLSKSSSFKAVDSSNDRKVVGGNMSGGYQTPQTKRDRANHSEGVYDSPKGRTPAVLQNGGGSEYQRPQAKGYLAPQDCVQIDAPVPHRPDPEGCSMSGT
ncbi:discoidin, CUB and LCCL domain-containing protein 1 isoform X2 [Neoarius graeffei]|uniref:discoidin, CUB and LCCL domain-containing protein 1 isoform X2 n=1 Tax=Neoarius graeffei TaxID=443677 RepID=UPI00298C975F|nr:discoidin, CUB and LCCL domain-containing protein 1 isoform X2 [Neoarius graeffei]